MDTLNACNSEFVREMRYFIIKLPDAYRYLTQDERNKLSVIGKKVANGRKNDNKNKLQCVVIESDWPEYDPTWKAIENRTIYNNIPQKVNMHYKVYFPADKIVNVTVYDGITPAYEGRHVGFTYILHDRYNQGNYVDVLDAIVTDTNSEEKKMVRPCYLKSL